MGKPIDIYGERFESGLAERDAARRGEITLDDCRAVQGVWAGNRLALEMGEVSRG